MIAYRPHTGGGNIPNRVIDAAMYRHSDGFGLMWRDADGLHTNSYAPNARKAFRKALKSLDRSGAEYAAHFRFATSGPKNTIMAHPYTYEDPDPAVGTVAIMHNGVIDIAHDHTIESDTNAFVRLVLTRLPSRWWDNEALVYLVNEAIGYSKLTIMTAHETVNLHEKRGEWDGGLWYSSNHRPVYKASTSIPVPYQYGHWDNATQKYIPAETCANPNSLVTVTKPTLAPTAVKSAAVLGLIEEADEVIRVMDQPTRFRSGGHNLTAIRDISLAVDADYEDAVICDECKTVGTVYVIDGDYYVDMSHMYGADDLNPDDMEDLLPGIVTGSERR